METSLELRWADPAHAAAGRQVDAPLLPLVQSFADVIERLRMGGQAAEPLVSSVGKLLDEELRRWSQAPPKSPLPTLHPLVATLAPAQWPANVAAEAWQAQHRIVLRAVEVRLAQERSRLHPGPNVKWDQVLGIPELERAPTRRGVVGWYEAGRLDMTRISGGPFAITTLQVEQVQLETVISAVEALCIASAMALAPMVATRKLGSIYRADLLIFARSLRRRPLDDIVASYLELTATIARAMGAPLRALEPRRANGTALLARHRRLDDAVAATTVEQQD